MIDMKFFQTIKVAVVVLFAVASVSCITEETVSNKEREKISLDAWIRLNRPDLLANYQEDGGYYVDLLEEGDEGIAATENDFGSEPIMGQDTCWIYVNMTGRDLNGTICLTRSGELADLCGTFSHFTHYVPYVTYCGSTNLGLIEGSYKAMRSELKIGDKTFKMRRGSKVRLYMPSSIGYGESGSAAEGGYEGQYSLDSSRPLIMELEVLRAIKNPSDKELDMVHDYTKYREQWKQAEKHESEKTDENDDLKLKGLYYSLDFNPKSDNVNDYRYIQPHLDGSDNPYVDSKKYKQYTMGEMNQKINDILLKRFGEGLSEEKRTEMNLVTKDGRANVWYVLRFLDGFVVDTNIAEIRTLVFDEVAPECEVFSYSPSDDVGKEESERNAIGAWFYCIPKMHYGAYGQIVTTSGYAYGAAGLTGTTTTTESSSTASYYNAMNYYNYYNSYYNYYSPYYNYYDYSYYNYNYNYDAEETVTTTTISTEILPYTPLVFTIYVEPNE